MEVDVDRVLYIWGFWRWRRDTGILGGAHGWCIYSTFGHSGSALCGGFGLGTCEGLRGVVGRLLAVSHTWKYLLMLFRIKRARGKH